MEMTRIQSPPSPASSSPAASGADRCHNCGAIPGSRYCGECGQQVYDGPLTFARGAERLLQGSLDLDRGFLFTLRELTLRPGAAIQSYLDGRSTRYTNPVRYLVVIAAATTLAMVVTGITEGISDTLTSGPVEELSESGRRFVEIFSTVFGQYYNLLTIAAVPFMAVATRVFFRGAGRTLPEHLVFNAFTYAHATLLFTALLLVLELAGNPEILNLAVLPLWFAYWTWAAITFFRTGVWSGFVRSFVGGTVATLAYYAVLIACVAAYVWLTA
jgi:hypothetical protein